MLLCKIPLNGAPEDGLIEEKRPMEKHCVRQDLDTKVVGSIRYVFARL